jgi:DNA gyrase subunit A
VVKLDLNEVDETEFKANGMKLSTLYDDAESGEIPIKVFDITAGLPEGDLIFFTEQGVVKRTEWSEYSLQKSAYPAIKLKPGDKVINVEKFIEDDLYTLCFVTKNGMTLNAVNDDVPCQGRIATGVKGMVLADNDSVIFATQINGEGEIIIVTDSGLFKRVISSLIDPIARARKGLMITDNKSKVLFADYVTLPYTLAVINDDKTIAELSTEDVAIDSRVSKGKPIKRADITVVKSVVALKYKSEYDNGSMQLKF